MTQICACGANTKKKRESFFIYENIRAIRFVRAVRGKILLLILFLSPALLLLSCSKMGYGVLLWSSEDPPILSGTVLPVYIRSNINQVWVVGVPNEKTKIEIPLTQFEFVGSKSKARKWAAAFFQFASTYAENLQDGLPIRDAADNGAKRVYRLRLGEIIKILELVEGNPPISTTGDPLPGSWYRVLTQDGVIGYCFSYRLNLFDYSERATIASASGSRDLEPDPDLDMVFSKTWSPESYLQMVNSRIINIDELNKKYHFDPGHDTGIAKIILPDMQMDFTYQSVVPDGERAWIFEGSNLQMHLRSNNTLAVQYTESSGGLRTLIFVALSANIDDLIVQENNRRERQFAEIYGQGPVYTSNNYGTISFSQNGNFRWTDFDLLVPQLISGETNGSGHILMDIFLSSSFADQYTGAVTFNFTDIEDDNIVRFMYSLDSNGLRLEAVPDYALEDITITRRSSTPVVLYFFKDIPY
jgi:hypothetical protein